MTEFEQKIIIGAIKLIEYGLDKKFILDMCSLSKEAIQEVNRLLKEKGIT